MIKWLIKHFVTNAKGEDERILRLKCGRLSGTIGISLNIVLGLVKLFIGLVTGSVAVMADAVNNLSDAAASVITLVGFSLASRKSDDDHPFGHARYEYMTGVVVSALVIVVGVQLIRVSYGKIINPTPIDADIIFIVLLAVFALIKLWLYRFNESLSALINSSSLKATGIDSRNDAISTVAALCAMLLFKFTGLNIDGFIGIAVGVFIIYSGLKMVRETAGPLLGQSPDPKTIKEIADFVQSYKGVLGIHDLIVHDYGPGHIFATVHIEVDSREDIFVSHELIDDIEKKAQEELHVMLVGHMDPLDTQNQEIPKLRKILAEAFNGVEHMKNFHDLRIVKGQESTNVIFDVVASHNEPEETFATVEKLAQEALSKMDKNYVVVINRDLDYAANEEELFYEGKEQ